jgi:hypothetical protein
MKTGLFTGKILYKYFPDGIIYMEWKGRVIIKSNLKHIPIGIDSFKKLIDRNCYFVDKSLFIKKLVEDTSEIILCQES